MIERKHWHPKLTDKVIVDAVAAAEASTSMTRVLHFLRQRAGRL